MLILSFSIVAKIGGGAAFIRRGAINRVYKVGHFLIGWWVHVKVFDFTCTYYTFNMDLRLMFCSSLYLYNFTPS